MITSLYKQKGGRLYSEIQNISKAVKRRLFKGFVDVNVNSALPAIMYELSKSKPRALLNYIRRKDQIRKHLAGILGSEEKAKLAINALFYGCNVNPYFIYKDWKNNLEPMTTFAREFGGYASWRLLKRDVVFKGLVKAVRQVVEEITEKAKKKAERCEVLYQKETKFGYEDAVVENGWKIINANDDELLIPIWNRRKVMSHIYVGLERRILKATGVMDEDVVLMHDGFIIRKDLNREELSRRVNYAMGFREIDFSIDPITGEES